MISMPLSVRPALDAVASTRISGTPRKRDWLAVLCALLAVLLCGAASNTAAQTAHFSGAQTTIGSGFDVPISTAVDKGGNVYVADYGNHAVKEIMAVNGSIPASPTIKTLPFSNFQYPTGIAVDSNGNVYVADSGSGLVIEFQAVNGSIPTSPNIIHLGSGFTAPISVAVDSMGDVFVADNGNQQSGIGASIKEILAVNGSIPASPTIVALVPNLIPANTLLRPGGIALDSQGDLYLVVPTPLIYISISTASNQSALGSERVSTAVSAANASVSNLNSGSVYEIHAVNGSIQASPTVQLLSTGIPGNLPNSYPEYVAVDNSGNVYITDNTYAVTSQMGSGKGINAVYEILADNGSIPASPTINVLASNFSDPMGVTVNGSGNLYISDATKNQIVEQFESSVNFGAENIGAASSAITMTFTFDTAGTLGSMAVLTQGASGLDFANAGTGSCKASTAYAAGQTCTINVTFTPRYAGSRYGAAALYNSTGRVIATGYIQGEGVGPQINFLPGVEITTTSGLSGPFSVAIDANNNLYMASVDGGEVVKETLSADGYVQSTMPSSGNVVAIDGSGNVYIADSESGAVYKDMLVNGDYVEGYIGIFYFPYGIAVDGSGNVYIAASENKNVFKETLTASGYTQSMVPTSGVSSLGAIAVDGSDNVYIADTYNNRVLKETLVAGSYSQSIVYSGAGQPQGISVDGNENVYIACAAPYQVLKETLTAGGYAQSTIASNSYYTPLYPTGVTIDGSGNVYIANSIGGSPLVKVDFADPPSLSFASTAVGSTSTDSPQTVTLQNIGNAALSFPIPSTGYNPNIAANFTLNDNGASACPVVGAGFSVPGTLAAGASCELPISFSPTVAGALSGSLVLTDNNLNAAAPGYASQTIALNGTGTQATPTITWATPAAITNGTALNSTQLNATSTVAGTFTYSPVAGTVLTAGAQTLSATFTPTDTTDYTTSTATVTLMVNQATPIVPWTTPAAIIYGTPLNGTQLNASSTVAGSFAYSPSAGTLLTAGQQALTVTFTPTDTTDYTIAMASVTLTVNKATPILTCSTPTPIVYGTPISAATFDCSANVPGMFVYNPAVGTVLTAGSNTLSIIFTPTDITDYTTAAASVALVVNKAIPTITWATPMTITYGTALSVAQLDANSTVAGSFTYSPAAGTVLTAGAQTLTVTFTPTDATDYTTASTSVTLNVNKATPSIAWAAPTAIPYGAALSGTQLNASSPVAGSFTYSPATGTVLTAGPETLTVTFTPSDSTNYNTAIANISLTVNKATPTITWATPAAITYRTALSTTQLDAKASVPGAFVYNPAVGIVPAVGTDTLTVTFTPTDTTDYTTATSSVQLKVNPAPSFTLGASPASLEIDEGASAKSTITVTGQNGFTGSVTLAASDLPSGVTAAFAPNPTTGSSALTLTASSTAAVGSATVTIKGTSGSLTASTTLALTVSCTPTTIVPYISLNGGSTWTEESSATVSSASTKVDLGPQPSSGGSWSWTGPNKYTSTSRQINSIPLTAGTDSFVATYTNSNGCKSTEAFTITVK